MSDSSIKPSGKHRRKPIGRRRLWLFRFAAILLGLLPLVVLESVLRLSGAGYRTEFLIRSPYSRASNAFVMNPAFDHTFFGQGDLPGPEPRPFVLPKPNDVFRIVVVGGSSVQGFPYPFELSFPRHLEIALEAQNPGQQFEVLNAGITAISSVQETSILRQAVQCQPDLLVLHSGHNEFYGIGGLASQAGGARRPLQPILGFLRKQRTFQVCSVWLHRPSQKNLLETLPADIEIALDDEVFEAVGDQYRHNLQAAVQIALDAGIPLMLTTVPANLRDLSPMSSVRDESLSSADRATVDGHLHAAVNHLSYTEYESALERLQQAGRLEPGNAVVAFREAQCLEMLGRSDEAAAAYHRACDLDGCRFRMPSRFADLVEKMAQPDESGILFCDVAGKLRARSAFPVPGNDFFLEHVHYNIEGHWQVALILAEQIQTTVLHREWVTARVPDEARRNEWLGLSPFDLITGDTFALMAYEAWPLNLAADSPIQSQKIKARIQLRYAGLSPLDRKLLADQSLIAMQQDLLRVLGDSFHAAGALEKALAAYQLHITRRPWEPIGYQRAADVLNEQGQAAAAEKMLADMPRSDLPVRADPAE